jgi:hypothetical protein
VAYTVLPELLADVGMSVINAELPKGTKVYAAPPDTAALLARITKLEARLEIRPDIPYDGIECRDETIRQYADQICDLKIRVSQQVEVMRKALDALEREATLAPIEATEEAMEALDAAIKKDMP